MTENTWLLHRFDAVVAYGMQDQAWDPRPVDSNYSIGYSHGGGSPDHEMTCATCGRKRTWSPRFFPWKMFAACWACVMRVYSPPKLPLWKVAP